MPSDITLDELRLRSARAGLTLSDQELQHMLSGVNRSQEQAAVLRELFADEIEPAHHFLLVLKG